MVLVIDNYDSFTYNLVQYLGEMQVDLQVHRNDQITLDKIRALNPSASSFRPGHARPANPASPTTSFAPSAHHIPIFGVCLGHQCIGHTFGAEVVVNSPHDARQNLSD